MNRWRLDAESVRDSALSVSGQLDLTMGGPPDQEFFFKDDHSPIYDYSRAESARASRHRRGVYRFLVRSVPDPFMESLDCPDASLLTPKRNTTLTALQALAMLNDPLMLKQVESFAQRLRGLRQGFDRTDSTSLLAGRGARTHATGAGPADGVYSKEWVGELLPPSVQQQRVHVCRLMSALSTDGRFF